MSYRRSPACLLTGTSPNTASTSILATQGGFAAYDQIVIDAVVLGATGGVLDLYLQRQIDPAIANAWVSIWHVAEIAAAASSKVYSLTLGLETGIVQSDLTNDDGTGTLALAAGAYVGGRWGDKLRLLAVAGASTSAGAIQKFYITGYKQYT